MKQAIQQVSTHLWRKDGEPQRQAGEPTSVGRDYYQQISAEVVRGLSDLGYRLIKPRAKRVRTGATACS